jgi:hypothetical protein
MPAVTRVLRPRQFLLWAGTVLVITGLAGATGFLGSISRASVFNPPYWINWVHLAFGVLVLAVGFAGGRTLQNALTVAPAILGTTVGLSGLLFGSYAANHYNMPELADPSEHLAHLTVGRAGTLGVVKQKRRTSAAIGDTIGVCSWHLCPVDACL